MGYGDRMNLATPNTLLFPDHASPAKLSGQLLKWIGNKQRFAGELIARFPQRFNRYVEPFVGSGAILATLAPRDALAGDAFGPLIEIWTELRRNPSEVIEWYAVRRSLADEMGKEACYAKVLSSYNANPNGADFLYLSRACYGGVVRFRKSDGYMSTPCGAHTPITADRFAERALEWHQRIMGTEFFNCDYRELMERAGDGDVVYCDPPYVDSQGILYGAQEFRLSELYDAVARCKKRGAFVALSIDGSKKSGRSIIDISAPRGLFTRELQVNCGRSMLRRFQMDGRSLEREVVFDRLLLTH